MTALFTSSSALIIAHFDVLCALIAAEFFVVSVVIAVVIVVVIIVLFGHNKTARVF